jgi:hypothetical protein
MLFGCSTVGTLYDVKHPDGDGDRDLRYRSR